MGKKRKKQDNKHVEIKVDKSDVEKKSISFLNKVESVVENKYVQYGWIALLIIIVIIISSYVRLGSLHLPVTDVWAENMVTDNYRGAIEQQVRAERPNLPESSIQRLVDEQYK